MDESSPFFPSCPTPHSGAPGTSLLAIFVVTVIGGNKKISKETEGKQKSPLKPQHRQAGVAPEVCVARGRADALGAFLSASCRVLASYTVEPLHKRVNHKLIILKKTNTNDSCLYIAGVVLTYISRLGSPGLDPTVLICFYPMQPEAS